MQSSMFITTALSLGLSLLTVAAQQETDVQARARQALRQKMAELETQTATTRNEILTEINKLHQEGRLTAKQQDSFRLDTEKLFAKPGFGKDAQAMERDVNRLRNRIAKAAKTVPAPAPAAVVKTKTEPAPAQAPAPDPAERLKAKAPESFRQQQSAAAKATPAPKAAEAPLQAAPAIAPAPVVPPAAEAKLEDIHAAARAALRRQQGLPVPEAKAPPTMKAAAPSALAPAPVPPPAVAPAPTPVPAPVAQTEVASESPALDAARALLRAKMREGEGQPPGAAPPAKAASEAVAEAEIGQKKEESPRRKLTRAGSQKSNVAAARRPSMFHKASGSKEKQMLAPNAAEPDMAQPAAPKTKRQKLAELLELYKADKLTPIQYHEERAKIVAEP
ncbi:MAG: hypothetical protein HY674_08790 [Chloroflexi bacterium]|nr:hypothetical protein [Chloroflexota bacterium]